MTKMHINGSESDVVRLFHLDLPPEAVERFTTQAGTGEWPLQYALGARQLRSAFVDVVSIRDLGEMPLSRYLAEAHQLTGDAFAQMRPRIDALKGHVVILPSQAFDHVTQDLSIATPLRWIGTFSEVKASPRGPALRSASARGRTSRPGPETAPRNRGLTYLLIGLGVLALLLLAALFRAG
ncbi:aspartate carbamoyltransferase catalytic subunit [Salipiger sp. PrR002]|uniref:aspartate carbamoyltransferase catalytic subunit n=1 Tax=Salipiger sp. PrR002 TaxID=2706489 RepID=UPI0013B82DCE|nr:aspartate carbamoyltransferase catalytic subunit [Salipiger sp. PrR002]NDV99171.1 aspartate carbamoyltransferase catalytic subunit [Salipiger sp. PrR002]NDW56124.1 aspartate carbamoyltransferase catalytic subunit [Salipiger sp. PrR004]